MSETGGPAGGSGVVAPSSAPEQRAPAGEPPKLRVRQRLARLGAVRSPQSAVLDPLFKVVRTSHPKADLAVIERAYHTAEHYHRGQVRKSGDPYITHPLAVTTILAELGMTEPTLCAALLHDTVEDTSYTLGQMTADFGAEIARLVDGVTKLDKLTYGERARAESIRKMLIAADRDIRVLLIKLADRLHNMRTLTALRPDKQVRIARDTLEIFAPLAHRMGMNAIKWELEDLAFATIEPKIYDEIVHLVADQAPRREKYLREIIDRVNEMLAKARVKATVYGRPKHYYSIYQKMVVRGRDFKDIYDLVGLRILVNSQSDCYLVMGLLHGLWLPLPGRIKDYIAGKKDNGYQSLHTTVMGPGNKPVEFQIRTHEMHRIAEIGVAAHWKYKAAQDGSDLAFLHDLNQWSREAKDPGELLDWALFELNADQVYLFTPQGEVVALPQDSTPVDFAFRVHTEVGNRCIGARVNGRLVPLDTKMNNGDTVEILTSKAENAGPSRDWLSFVASPRARSKIKQFFSRERRDEAIDKGREALARHMRRSGLPLQRILTAGHLTAVAGTLRMADVASLYQAVGEGHISAPTVVRELMALEGGSEEARAEGLDEQPVARRSPRAPSGGPAITVGGDTHVFTKLARCCLPLPGDDIVGFVTRGDGISVHRQGCPNAEALAVKQADRIVDVAWSEGADTTTFLVSIHVEGLDRSGLLSEVTRAMAEQHVNIVSAEINAGRDKVFNGRITFESPGATHLQHVLENVRRVPGIYDAYRVAG